LDVTVLSNISSWNFSLSKNKKLLKLEFKLVQLDLDDQISSYIGTAKCDNFGPENLITISEL
jgi:hypothetical protein